MSDVKMKIYRVMQSKAEYSHAKPVAHNTNKDDAVKLAQSLQLRADKFTRYHVDSVEVY